MIKLTSLCLLVIVGLTVGQSSWNLDKEWESFKIKFEKSYDNLEQEVIHKEIFAQNVARIHKHNYEADLGLHTYRLGITRFTDLAYNESTTMPKINSNAASFFASSVKLSSPSRSTLHRNPLSVDWKAKGLVSEVGDQGACKHAGWAFAAIATIEGQLAKSTGKLIPLSPAQLIDCSIDHGNSGCKNGSIENAFEYIKDCGGVNALSEYPFHGKGGRCRFSWSKSVTSIRGYNRVASNREDLLASAVATVGPIATWIDASGDIRYYSSGIFSDDACGSNPLNHAVTIVGFGTENGLDYWLVKNSWGRAWGEAGYIRIQRNANNQCGIASSPVYPYL